VIWEILGTEHSEVREVERVELLTKMPSEVWSDGSVLMDWRVELDS